MADILHEVVINATANKVYEAITTEEGLKGWYTSKVRAQPEVGSVAVLGFNNRAEVFKMHLDALVPGKQVVWSCQDAISTEWPGTIVQFRLKPQGEERTLLRFGHTGWQSTEGEYARCNTVWGELMFRLKMYAEGKQAGPHFTDTGTAYGTQYR